VPGGLSKKLAQLYQRDRATRYVSQNLLKYSTTVRKRAFEMAYDRYVTLKVTQSYQKWRDSGGGTYYFVLVVCSNNVAIFPRYFHFYNV